ncbi:MAG TPA: LodA/GoxA family CTQ-dependent oxidase [Vicinamibacterales bacterium]|nr:LodA/GoxA family CTQ-dependent oxidase [Vicinamibacterales bacterium]
MTKRIVRAAIHPGIGIARVGNSRDEFFIGPEVEHPDPMPPNFYKDASGALKRQGARFRIYGFDEDDQVVAELTAANAVITWTAHLANKKAAWYNFEIALDIPEAVPAARRNAAMTGSRRKQLEIDPGERSITGQPDQSPIAFDSGRFLDTPVYLGELRTDDAGRLIVLGGRGISDTPFAHNTPYTYANNDGWYDDVSDGPVTARVHVDGEELPVDPAWVVVAPPNYAPTIKSVQTLYDVLVDAYQNKFLMPVTTPSFTQHIYPLLRQFSGTQWVNWGFHLQFGWGGPNDFRREDYMRRLSTITRDAQGVTDIYKELRLQVLHLFRQQDDATDDPGKWPQVHGDAAGLDSPRANLALTATQYARLSAWANGTFLDDWRGEPAVIGRFEDVPLAEQPASLDKAALWYCSGGPFHPGCELTWPMRTCTMYYAPFRIRERRDDQEAPDYGDQLTPQVATSEYGPLYASRPGDLTRWLAVPWQTDTASCYAGMTGYDPYLPTFWPARVPNHVLAEAEYQAVVDTTRPLAERHLAFDTRSVWPRFLEGAWLDRMNQMITDFGKMGIVERRDGPPDGEFPSQIYVESQVGFSEPVHFQRNLDSPPNHKIHYLRHMLQRRKQA